MGRCVVPLPDELRRLTPDQVSRTLDKLNRALPSGWRAGYTVFSQDGQPVGFYATQTVFLAELPAAALEKARGLR